MKTAPTHYWIVWAVDDRATFRHGKHRHCRYVNGVPTPVDPKKRVPFSYLAWTQPFAGRPWDYRREMAERFPTKAAAFLARDLAWLLGWGRGDGTKSVNECYGVTRVRRVAPGTTQARSRG